MYKCFGVMVIRIVPAFTSVSFSSSSSSSSSYYYYYYSYSASLSPSLLHRARWCVHFLLWPYLSWLLCAKTRRGEQWTTCHDDYILCVSSCSNPLHSCSGHDLPHLFPHHEDKTSSKTKKATPSSLMLTILVLCGCIIIIIVVDLDLKIICK